MIQEGVLIMFIGMGTVYVFFFVMILITNLLGAVIKRYNQRFPEKTDSFIQPPAPSRPPGDDAVALAIAAARRMIK